MSPPKKRIHDTQFDNLVGNLRGEVGEAITTWFLWRAFRAHELSMFTDDIKADMNNVALRRQGVLVGRLRDDLTARLSELGERKVGRINFHFAAVKRPEFQPLADEYTRYVTSRGLRTKRNRDISHKNLPERWEDHRHLHVGDRILTRATGLAVRVMKRIDLAMIGPYSRLLWREMRRRRYEPLLPPASGYLLMPFIRVSPEDRVTSNGP